MNRLIVFKDRFVFVDVTDIAKSLWGKEDLYVVDIDRNTKHLIEKKDDLNHWLGSGTLKICIKGGHLPTPSIDWWSKSEKITHKGYVYVRTKDKIK